VLVEGQYMNRPLNRCARLMAIVHGGQVVISGTTEALLHGDPPEGVGLLDLGEHRLRDLSEPLRVFEVRHSALPASFRRFDQSCTRFARAAVVAP
jgi:class 3 adenylate cyclase